MPFVTASCRPYIPATRGDTYACDFHGVMRTLATADNATLVAGAGQPGTVHRPWYRSMAHSFKMQFQMQGAGTAENGSRSGLTVRRWVRFGSPFSSIIIIYCGRRLVTLPLT